MSRATDIIATILGQMLDGKCNEHQLDDPYVTPCHCYVEGTVDVNSNGPGGAEVFQEL